MATIAELLIKLGMDDGGLDKGMSSSQSKLKSWGESLRSVGTKLTAGVTLPLVGAGLAALKWSSDLEEAGNKVDVVFGDSAQAIRDWADTTEGSLLLSSSEALDAAGSFGNLFTTIGFTTEEAAKLSTGFVELAQDVSSFYNIPVDQALDAMSAAFIGEYDALQRFVPAINAAAVEQKALEMGIWDGVSAMTAQQKALAINELIWEQTAAAQGDAARTSKNFANQMRRLRSDLKDLGAALGTLVMPYVEQFLERALELVKTLSELDPKWQKVILAVAAFAAVLGPALIALGFMLPVLGAIATAIGFLLSPIGLLVIAIAALIGLGIYAWANDLWGVRDAVDAVIDALSVFTPMLGDLVDVWQAAREGDWAEVFDELKDAAISLGQALFELQGIVMEALAGIFGRLLDWIQGYDWYGLLNSVGQQLNDGLMAGLQALSDAAFPVLQEWANGVVLVLTTLKAMAVEQVQGMALGIVMYFSLLASDIKAQVDAIQASIGAAFTLTKVTAISLATELAVGVVAHFTQLGAAIRILLTAIKNDVFEKFAEAKNQAVSVVSQLYSAVNEQFRQLSNDINGKVGVIRDNVTNRFKEMSAQAVAEVFFMAAKIISEIVSMGSSLATEAFNAGASVASGLAAGIDSLYDWAVGRAKALGASVIQALEDAIIPGSPSKVTTYYGKMLAAGLVVGMDSMENRVIAASDRMASAALQPMGDLSVGGNAGFGGSNQTGGNTYISISLKSQELIDLIRNAEDGGEFSRNFGSQMGLYAGMP